MPRWDEFGFRVEEEDGPEDSSSKLLSIPFQESPRYYRLFWLYGPENCSSKLLSIPFQESPR